MISPTGLPIVAPPGDSTVTFLSTDVIGQFRSSAIMLRNQDACGMLVDKIVFAIGVSSGIFRTKVRLRWRDQPLTNGWATIAAITYPLNGRTGITAAVLKLAKPMYLPPGEWVVCDYQLGDTLGQSNSIAGALVGRQVASPPAERWLPYLSAFDSNAVAPGGTFSGTSTPQDLGNPFSTPMLVDRLTFAGFTGANATKMSLGYGNVPSNALVEITDHDANGWIYPAAPIQLLGSRELSWKVGVTMPPKGYLRVEYSSRAASAASSYVMNSIGLIGYRRIIG